MAKATLKDGRVIRFPDGLPPDRVKMIIQKASQSQPEQAAPQQPQVGVGEDMAKTILPSLGRGAIGMASFPAQAGEWLGQKATSGIDYLMGVPPEQTAQRQAQAQQALSKTTMLPNPANLQQSVEGATGPWYQPQTVPGEYVDTAGQFAASLPVGGPKNMVRKGVGLLTSALSSETAGQVARNTVPEAEPYARFFGAAAGGRAQPSGRGAILKSAPTAQAVASKTDAAYGLLRNAGIKYDAKEYSNFADNLQSSLTKDGLDPILHPMASRALERVVELKGTFPEFQKIDTLRQITGDILKSPEAKERRMAAVILRKLDAFTEQNAITSNGQLSTQQVQKLADHARELARRNIITRDLSEVDRKSGWYPSGDESGVRNQVASYGKSAKGKYLTQPEEKAFKKMVRREGLYNLLTTTGGRLNLAVSPGVGGLIGSAFGPAGAAIGAGVSIGGHLLSRKIMEKVSQRALEDARKTVLLGKRGQHALPKGGLLNRNTVLPLLGAGATINNSYGR